MISNVFTYYNISMASKCECQLKAADEIQMDVTEAAAAGTPQTILTDYSEENQKTIVKSDDMSPPPPPPLLHAGVTTLSSSLVNSKPINIGAVSGKTNSTLQQQPPLNTSISSPSSSNEDAVAATHHHPRHHNHHRLVISPASSYNSSSLSKTVKSPVASSNYSTSMPPPSTYIYKRLMRSVSNSLISSGAEGAGGDGDSGASSSSHLGADSISEKKSLHTPADTQSFYSNDDLISQPHICQKCVCVIVL